MDEVQVLGHLDMLREDAVKQATIIRNVREKLKSDDKQLAKRIKDIEVGSERNALEYSAIFYNSLGKLKDLGVEPILVESLINSTIMLERYRNSIFLENIIN